MRFTAALRRFIAPSKHKMCPAGKRAHAWVHPHFAFTADCRLNRPTFPDFLPRTAFQFVSTDLLFPSYVPGLLYSTLDAWWFHLPLFARSRSQRSLPLSSFTFVFSFVLNCMLRAQNDRIWIWFFKSSLVLSVPGNARFYHWMSDVFLLVRFL